MIDAENTQVSAFSTSPWTPDGTATLVATGADVRSALEAGLSAVLSLAVAPTSTPRDADRSAPIRGEGDDLAGLFADMVDDLLEQVAEFGAGLHGVVVDGVLRRDGGGYVAWGYATGTLEPVSSIEPPRLHDNPTVSEQETRITIQAALRRA